MNPAGRLSLVVLEDNQERRDAMTARLQDRLPQFDVVFAATAAECIDWLHRRWNSLLAVSLDHDLELIAASGRKLLEPGTGLDVADFLSERTAICPVIIHSTNIGAAEQMQELLQSAGWPVTRITPYGDLEWIDEVWFPALRAAMNAWPARSAQTTANQRGV